MVSGTYNSCKIFHIFKNEPVRISKILTWFVWLTSWAYLLARSLSLEDLDILEDLVELFLLPSDRSWCWKTALNWNSWPPWTWVLKYASLPSASATEKSNLIIIHRNFWTIFHTKWFLLIHVSKSSNVDTKIREISYFFNNSLRQQINPTNPLYKVEVERTWIFQIYTKQTLWSCS